MFFIRDTLILELEIKADTVLMFSYLLKLTDTKPYTWNVERYNNFIEIKKNFCWDFSFLW